MKRTIWLPLTLLVLSALACSFLGSAEKAVEVGQEAATKASQAATAVGEEVGLEGETSEEAEPGDDEEETGAAEVDPDALSGLDAYRVRLRTEWVPNEGEADRTVFEQAHTRDPQAQRLVVGGDEEEAFEFVQVEDQAWYCSGGSCSQANADPEDLMSGFGSAMMFDPGDVTDQARANFVGRESVNGVQTRHYTLNLTAMEAAILSQGDVSDVQGDAWIADEGDLPAFTVRFQMSWLEKRGSRAGRGELFYEVYDVNAPFTIEPPEGADKVGLPEDVPVYPNAEGGFTMEGMVTFESSDDAATIADFYRDGLAAEGWTSERDDELEGTISQLWQKDGRQLMLMISPDDGKTNVTLTVE